MMEKEKVMEKEKGPSDGTTRTVMDYLFLNFSCLLLSVFLLLAVELNPIWHIKKKIAEFTLSSQLKALTPPGGSLNTPLSLSAWWAGVLLVIPCFSPHSQLLPGNSDPGSLNGITIYSQQEYLAEKKLIFMYEPRPSFLTLYLVSESNPNMPGSGNSASPEVTARRQQWCEAGCLRELAPGSLLRISDCNGSLPPETDRITACANTF